MNLRPSGYEVEGTFLISFYFQSVRNLNGPNVANMLYPGRTESVQIDGNWKQSLSLRRVSSNLSSFHPVVVDITSGTSRLSSGKSRQLLKSRFLVGTDKSLYVKRHVEISPARIEIVLKIISAPAPSERIPRQ